MILPTFSDILAAHELIKPYIHQTPVLTSKSINVLIGCELLFKCENFQKLAPLSFGVLRMRFSLSEEEAASGVGTTLGNHAAALALAAKSGDKGSHRYAVERS